MLLLISPVSVEEAQTCVKAAVDIIDVKNPQEGSLGANFPWVIKAIRKAVPPEIPISATIGDVPFKPGTVSLAALGAAHAGASFIKVGLLGTRTVTQAIELMRAVTKTIDKFKLSVSVVAAGYAEGTAIGSIAPLDIPLVASESASDFAMLDTFNKTTGESLFDHLSFADLETFITHSRKLGLGTALGGALQRKHIPLLKKLQPDIVGIRSVVCENGDRFHGKLSEELIQGFRQELRQK